MSSFFDLKARSNPLTRGPDSWTQLMDLTRDGMLPDLARDWQMLWTRLDCGSTLDPTRGPDFGWTRGTFKDTWDTRGVRLLPAGWIDPWTRGPDSSLVDPSRGHFERKDC